MPRRRPARSRAVSSARKAGASAARSGVAVLVAVAVLWAAPAVDGAFKANTQDTGNSFATGTISLTDDDSGTAMFAPATITPSTPAVGCISVTYGGSASATVKLYATIGGTSSLHQYVTLKIEEGTGGSSSSCTGFSATSTLVTTTLNSWTATTWAAGLSSWAPSGSATRTYRFTASLAAGTPANQQGLSVTILPTWEARAGT